MPKPSFEERKSREVERKSLKYARDEIRSLVKRYKIPRHVAADIYMAGATFAGSRIHQRSRTRVGGMYGEEVWEEPYMDVEFRYDDIRNLTKKIERGVKSHPTSE